jgi:hypothetical protein
MVPAPGLPSEMVSGPDLGGGFLHQLSIDRDGTSTTFTYHAQDGGSDAGGPPKGSLNVFGWAPTSTPCTFGGPRCWHRRFDLPFSAVPQVRAAYNRYRFVLATLMDQAYAGAPVDIEGALGEMVRRVAEPLRADGIEWYVGGSVAARLLGAPVAPRDIDLGTTRGGVERLGSLLAPYLIEPVAPTQGPDARRVVGARAFVGTLTQGAPVEWAVPLGEERTPSLAEFSGTAGVARTIPASFQGVAIPVTRPEYGLVRAEERRRRELGPPYIDLIRKLGPDLELLEVLLERSSLSSADRERVRNSVAR